MRKIFKEYEAALPTLLMVQDAGDNVVLMVNNPRALTTKLLEAVEVGLMTEEETIEVYFSKGVHLGTTFEEPGSGLIFGTVLEGERFSSRLVALVNDFGGNDYKLVLSWSPSHSKR